MSGLDPGIHAGYASANRSASGMDCRVKPSTMKHRHLRFGPTSIDTVGIRVGVGARTEENLCLIVTESAGNDLEAKSLRNERESQR
jgi:hypothetical protein